MPRTSKLENKKKFICTYLPAVIRNCPIISTACTHFVNCFTPCTFIVPWKVYFWLIPSSTTTSTPSGHHIIWCSSKKVSRKWLRKKRTAFFGRRCIQSDAHLELYILIWIRKIKLRSFIFLKGRDFFSRQILT